ncbi:hypothetical protein KP509_25G057900 [Ceratopteris richardii]|uniref:DUF4378 domain-containing protein n=1 Tax=Ceratopteris richardii TaxID=49495 RepID=A0A8T2RT62_CERRI|nr:hypothetical protein KP509_25G057900 [Ceratopteris richardii]
MFYFYCAAKPTRRHSRKRTDVCPSLDFVDAERASPLFNGGEHAVSEQSVNNDSNRLRAERENAEFENIKDMADHRSRIDTPSRESTAAIVYNEHQIKARSKSPGVIARLMGLENFPFEECIEDVERKGCLDMSSCRDTTVVEGDFPPHQPSPAIPKGAEILEKIAKPASEYEVQENELNALLDELNGSMCTIFSYLGAEVSICCRSQSRTQTVDSASGLSSSISSVPSTTACASNRNKVSRSLPMPQTCARSSLNPQAQSVESSLRGLGKKDFPLIGSERAKTALIEKKHCGRPDIVSNGTNVKRKDCNAKSDRTPGIGVNTSGNYLVYSSIHASQEVANDDKVGICKSTSRTKVDRSVCQGGVGDEGAARYNFHSQQMKVNRKEKDNASRGSSFGPSHARPNFRHAGNNHCKNVETHTMIQKGEQKVGKSRTCTARHIEDDNAKPSRGKTSTFMRFLIRRKAAREAAIAKRQALKDLEAGTSCNVVTVAESVLELENCSNGKGQITEVKPDLQERRQKLSTGRSEGVMGGTDLLDVRQYASIGIASRDAAYSSSKWQEVNGEDDYRESLLASSRGKDSGSATKVASSESGVPYVLCENVNPMKTRNHGMNPGRNTTAAMLQDLVCALQGGGAEAKSPASRHRRCHRRKCNLPQIDVSEVASSSTLDQGNDTESTTSESATCCSVTSNIEKERSPVSVLQGPFIDEGDTVAPYPRYRRSSCLIHSEEDYLVAVLDAIETYRHLVASIESGDGSLHHLPFPPLKCFEQLEERVVPANWTDSEVLSPTQSYRKLLFDCACEALLKIDAMKLPPYNHKQRPHALLAEMRRWRYQYASGTVVLDDLVEADLRLFCKSWLNFKEEVNEVSALLQQSLLELLIDELVRELALTEQHERDTHVNMI